jgi:membrane protein CcdC involved in cytochrome C biogenesis
LILADGRFSVPEKIAIITSGIFFGVFVIKTTRSRMRKNDTYINTKIDTMKK